MTIVAHTLFSAGAWGAVSRVCRAKPGTRTALVILGAVAGLAPDIPWFGIRDWFLEGSILAWIISPFHVGFDIPAHAIGDWWSQLWIVEVLNWVGGIIGLWFTYRKQ